MREGEGYMKEERVEVREEEVTYSRGISVARHAW